MGLSSVECENIIESSLDKGKRVFCVMQNRYSGAARLLKELIEDEALGEIQMISIGCYWNRDARYYLNSDGSRHPWRGHSDLDGGVLFTQFAHFIDLIYWLFGNVDIDHVSLGPGNAALLTNIVPLFPKCSSVYVSTDALLLSTKWIL